MKSATESRSGMTMVELVSALMIFIFMLGGLTMALNKVTGLWSSAHTGQYEQEKADLILSLIGSDLAQAVTDNAPLRETGGEPPPTFLCGGTADPSGGDLRFLLQFIRHPPHRTVIRDQEPPALEAVFYTFYRNALFRHVVPLAYTDPDAPEHLGELLEEASAQADDPALHDAVIAYAASPAAGAPSVAWECSLLAERIMPPVVLAGIKQQYADSSGDLVNPAFELSNSLRTLPEYQRLESRVLPDYVFIALRIFNQNEWNDYATLERSADPDTYARREPHLGRYASRRYSFMTLKGARLP
jgi:hypothetical protein